MMVKKELITKKIDNLIEKKLVYQYINKTLNHSINVQAYEKVMYIPKSNNLLLNKQINIYLQISFRENKTIINDYKDSLFTILSFNFPTYVQFMKMRFPFYKSFTEKLNDTLKQEINNDFEEMCTILKNNNLNPVYIRYNGI